MVLEAEESKSMATEWQSIGFSGESVGFDAVALLVSAVKHPGFYISKSIRILDTRTDIAVEPFDLYQLIALTSETFNPVDGSCGYDRQNCHDNHEDSFIQSLLERCVRWH